MSEARRERGPGWPRTMCGVLEAANSPALTIEKCTYVRKS